MITNPAGSEIIVVDTARIQVRKIQKDEAKDMIVKNHYLHKWSSSTICFGVFKDEFQFAGIEIANLPIGVLVFGYPVRRGLAREISPLLGNRDVLELKRLWIADGHGKNIESYAIGESFRLLKIHRPEVKVLVSYADPAAGHRGTIYRATNWNYQKVNKKSGRGSSFAISLNNNPKPSHWIHSRTGERRFGRHGIDILKRKIGRDFLVRWDSDKFRYIYFLSKKSEKKKLLESLRIPIEDSYSKEMNYSGAIERICVEPQFQIQRSIAA